jgi:hypothetical protein
LAVSLLIICSLVAACGGHTTGPTGVTKTTATLNAVGWCDANDEGRIYWEYRPLGASTWTRKYHGGDGRVLPQSGSKVQTDPCTSRTPSSGSVAFSQTIDGLTPGTTYQYRIGFRYTSNGSEAWTDSSGNPMPSSPSYSSFTTGPCSDTQGASESLADFISSNPAGTSSAPVVLCVRGGTQSIGVVSPKAYQTIKGVSDNTLQGDFELANPHVTLEDLRIRGCYATAGCSAGSNQNRVVEVNGDGDVVRYDDISQDGGKDAQNMQCMEIGEGAVSIRPVDVLVENSKIHGCGDEIANDHDHAIYCQDTDRPILRGNWLYDAEGWGFHLYPDCDNALVEGNMNAENGNSCVLDGDSGLGVASTNAQFRYGFCGFSRQHITGSGANNEDPIHCTLTTPPVSGSAVDMVLYDPQAPAVTDCGSLLTQSNTLNADPGFVDRDGSDGTYDLHPTATAAKERTGLPYAENTPGPSW